MTRSQEPHILDNQHPQTPEDTLGFLQHQMRTKVGIIIGSVDILTITETELTPESTEDLARIRRAALDMLSLAEQFDALGQVHMP